MPPKKKKRLSKAKRKALFKDLSTKGNQRRGLGVGGRRDFELPARWQTQYLETSDGKTREQYLSPGKTTYKSQKSVKETFHSRDKEGLLLFNGDSSSSEADDSQNDPDYCDCETLGSPFKNSPISSVEVEDKMFVCQTPQLMDFVRQINKTKRKFAMCYSWLQR